MNESEDIYKIGIRDVDNSIYLKQEGDRFRIYPILARDNKIQDEYIYLAIQFTDDDEKYHIDTIDKLKDKGVDLYVKLNTIVFIFYIIRIPNKCGIANHHIRKMLNVYNAAENKPENIFNLMPMFGYPYKAYKAKKGNYIDLKLCGDRDIEALSYDFIKEMEAIKAPLESAN